MRPESESQVSTQVDVLQTQAEQSLSPLTPLLQQNSDSQKDLRGLADPGLNCRDTSAAAASANLLEDVWSFIKTARIPPSLAGASERFPDWQPSSNKAARGDVFSETALPSGRATINSSTKESLPEKAKLLPPLQIVDGEKQITSLPLSEADSKRLDYVKKHRQIDSISEGDTLYGIARGELRKRGEATGEKSIWDEVKRLAKLNGISDPDLIGAGEKLKLYDDKFIASFEARLAGQSSGKESRRKAASEDTPDQSGRRRSKDDGSESSRDRRQQKPDESDRQKRDRKESQEGDRQSGDGRAEHSGSATHDTRKWTEAQKAMVAAALSGVNEKMWRYAGFSDGHVDGGNLGCAGWQSGVCKLAGVKNMEWSAGASETGRRLQKAGWHKVSKDDIRPGDIVVWTPAYDGGHGHIGTVVPGKKAADKQLEYIKTHKEIEIAGHNGSLASVAKEQLKERGIKPDRKMMNDEMKRIADLNGLDPKDRLKKGERLKLYDDKFVSACEQKLSEKGSRTNPLDGLDICHNSSGKAHGVRASLKSVMGGRPWYVLRPPDSLVAGAAGDDSESKDKFHRASARTIHNGHPRDAAQAQRVETRMGSLQKDMARVELERTQAEIQKQRPSHHLFTEDWHHIHPGSAFYYFHLAASKPGSESLFSFGGRQPCKQSLK